MFLPLTDDNPTRRFYRPLVNWALIALTTVIFVVFQSGVMFALAQQAAIAFGLIPSVFTGHNTVASDVFHAPALVTPLTYMVLHGSWAHLFGNMLFLYIFGDNVEADMGRLRYLLFYLGAGAASGIGFAWCVPTSDSPLIGASGAVAAVLGAYLVLHPNVRIIGLLLKFIPVKIPAFWFILSWFMLQIGHALFDPNQGVAWVAHIVGLVVGALAVLLMRLPRALGNLRRAGMLPRK